jgi:hypothetical protein
MVSDVTQLSEEKNDGFRTYQAEVSIYSEDIIGLECSAPIRRHKEWFKKQIQVNVLIPQNITFDGDGKLLEKVYFKDGEGIEIMCKADGEPKPWYKWNFVPEQIIPQEFIIEEEFSGWSKVTIPSEFASKFVGTFQCMAGNRIQILTKSFQIEMRQESELSSLVWIGILVPIAVICVGIIIGLLVWKIVKQQRKLRLLSEAEIDEFMNGRPETLQNSRSSSQYDVNSYATCLPYNKNYEVLKEQLEIGSFYKLKYA